MLGAVQPLNTTFQISAQTPQRCTLPGALLPKSFTLRAESEMREACAKGSRTAAHPSGYRGVASNSESLGDYDPEGSSTKI